MYVYIQSACTYITFNRNFTYDLKGCLSSFRNAVKSNAFCLKTDYL